MLRLYDYAASANCLKARLLLARLGLDYERVEIDIFAGENDDPRFRALSPAGRVPVLELEDGSALPESNAILLYLADGTELMPAALQERAQVWRWLFFEQNQLEPNLGIVRFWQLTGRAEANEQFLPARTRSAQAALDALERHLSAQWQFLVGSQFTAADVSVYAYAHVAEEAGFSLGDYPAISAWLARVEAQPGHHNDLQPYPANTRPGAGVSAYD